MNNSLVIKLYGIISITFVLLMLTEAIIKEKIESQLLIKIIDYSFWYVFGLFSAFFILRRIIKEKDNKRNGNMMSPN